MPKLYVDPGTWDVAVARFNDKGEYDVAHLLRSKSGTLADRITDMVQQFSDLPVFRSGTLCRIVVEIPKVRDRRHQKKKVDPDDLIRLSVVGGAFLAFGRPGVIRRPEEWKAQLPKGVCRTRLTDILSKEELRTFKTDLAQHPEGLQHNMWDALGIGLHDLGRFILR